MGRKKVIQRICITILSLLVALPTLCAPSDFVILGLDGGAFFSTNFEVKKNFTLGARAQDKQYTELSTGYQLSEKDFNINAGFAARDAWLDDNENNHSINYHWYTFIHIQPHTMRHSATIYINGLDTYELGLNYAISDSSQIQAGLRNKTLFVGVRKSL